MRGLTSLITLIILVAVLIIMIGIAYKANTGVRVLQDYMEIKYMYLNSWLAQRLNITYNNTSRSYVISIMPTKEIEYVISVCGDSISAVHVGSYTYSISPAELNSMYTRHCRIAVISSDGAILWLNNYITKPADNVDTTNNMYGGSLLNDLLYSRVYHPGNLEQYGLCQPQRLDYRIGFGKIDVNFTPTLCCFYLGSQVVYSPSKIIALNQYVDIISNKSRKVYTNKQLISGDIKIIELYSDTLPIVSLFTRIRDAITHVQLANSTTGNIVGIYSDIPGTINNGTDHAWGKKSYVNEQILLLVNNTYNLRNTSTRLLLVEQGALLTAKLLSSCAIRNPEINATLKFINMSDPTYNIVANNIGLNLTLDYTASTGNYVFTVTVNNTTILKRELDKIGVELIVNTPILTTPYYDLVLGRVWLFYYGRMAERPAIATTLLIKAKQKLAVQAHIMRKQAIAKHIAYLAKNKVLESQLKVEMIQEIMDGRVIDRGEKTQILAITGYKISPATANKIRVTLYIPKMVVVVKQ